MEINENVCAEIQISDTHCGHKTGIMYPDPNLEDVKPNKPQKWLLKCFETFVYQVEEVLDIWKPAHVHLSFLGDMGDVDYKGRSSSEFWTKNKKDVADNFVQVVRPLVAMADSLHVVRGTKAHVGEAGGVDELIASSYGPLVDQQTGNVLSEGIVVPSREGTFSHWYADFELAGVMFNISHHGRNKSKWTDYTGLASLKAEVILDRTKDGERIPDVICRGHFHYGLHLPFNDLPCAVAVPSWQLPNDFIYRVDPVNSTPKVGGYVMICRDGKIPFGDKFMYKYPRKKVWKPKLKA